MKLRLFAVTCVALAISALGVTAAGASTHIDVQPYLNNNIAIGTSAPGDPSSVLCLVLQDGAATYGGKVNGTVDPNRTGELNILIRAQDLVTPLPTCTATAIGIDTVDATNLVIQGLKPGTGTLQVSTSTAVQPGINATATTSLRVHYTGTQVVKLPTGASVVGGQLSGGSFVDLAMKPVATITKASLNLAACSDNQYLIDSNTPDGSKSNGPTATKLNTASPFSTTPKLGDAGVYVATIRDCAENTAATPGKPVTVKISISGGAGAVSVDFLNSSTNNPAVWDTTRGSSCSAVKTAGTFGTALQSSRVIQCKGDYGAAIPLSLAVRNWVASGVGFKDSYGLIHPGPPVQILSGSIS